MDDPTSWTPGELPDPPQGWDTPSAPGPSGPHGSGTSSYGGPGYGSSSRDPFFSGSSQGGPFASGPSYAGPANPASPANPAPGYQAPYAPPGSTPYAPPMPGALPAYGATGPLGYQTSPTAVGFPGAAPPGGYGPYPPPGMPYGTPYGPYQPYPGKPGFEGFAIAAFVVGILGGLLALVFGPIALHRIRKSGARGRGLAIAGIVVAAAWILLAIALPVANNQRHQALRTACANGDMTACDTLYSTSADGSADQKFGNTCGGRTDGGYLCTAIGDRTYGDDAQLDALWDACAAGDPQACDELSWSAQPGTDYAEYGQTCGGRTDGSVDCVDAMGEAAQQQT